VWQREGALPSAGRTHLREEKSMPMGAQSISSSVAFCTTLSVSADFNENRTPAAHISGLTVGAECFWCAFCTKVPEFRVYSTLNQVLVRRDILEIGILFHGLTFTPNTRAILPHCLPSAPAILSQQTTSRETRI
jgi:hypothetical protein